MGCSLGSRSPWRTCRKSSRWCSRCSLGAWRISQSGVLTRRAPAIETLGSTTVLCVDKTGTLTQNRMAVRRLWIPGRELDLLASQAELLPALVEYSVLA